MIYNRIRNTSKAKKSANLVQPNETELIQFLKQCVVTKNKQELKSKLADSIDLRRKLLRENKEEFAEFMAFYFADPELVRQFHLFSYSFRIMKFCFCRFNLTLGCFIHQLIRMHCVKNGKNC